LRAPIVCPNFNLNFINTGITAGFVNSSAVHSSET
jgi:hypothetical protein